MANQTSSKPRLIEVNRNQLLLRPVDVEELVVEDHPVRAIWEFVGKVDLSSFYKEILSLDGTPGRPAWDPRLMVSLWVYAYSQGEGSAREIAKLCEKDPAYQWLTGMESINHHTISDFRSHRKRLLDQLFQQVLGLLAADGLITLERVMHDGTKIRAYASSDTFRRENKIREYLELAKKQVKELGDIETQNEAISRQKAAKERAARERKEKLELALLELEKIRAAKPDKESKEQARASITDPQARIMKQGDGGYASSYNAQISTDSAAGIIVGVAVTQSASDYTELVPAVEKVKENLGSLPDQIVVDGGFTSRENILAMENKKVDLIGSPPQGSSQGLRQLERRGVTEEFYPGKFQYDAVNDTYTCPAGKPLPYKTKGQEIGRTNLIYQAHEKDCSVCPSQSICCPGSKNGRRVIRGVEDPIVVAFRSKMETEEARTIYKQRGPVAEFTNAWLKAKIGLRQFCLQGLDKVESEILWACLTYNIQQWIRLRWVVQA